MTAPSAKAAARQAEASPVFELFARAGYVANGIVHILLGVLVLVIAFGGEVEGDQAGVLKAVAAAPLDGRTAPEGRDQVSPCAWLGPSPD